MAAPNLSFKKLSSSAFLYTPPLPPSFSSLTDPTLIIICQWMGVSPRSRALNAAYQKYHSLYPAARILTLRSPPEAFFSTSTASRLASFDPIVSIIDSDPAPRILVHLFSNGGALTFTDICTVYKRSSGNVLTVKALVLDSAPGQPTFKESWTALSFVLPKGLFWYPSAAIVAGALGISHAARTVFGFESLVYKTSRLLNDWTLVDKSAKRLYIFSEGDRLVGWRDVERHAEECRKEGVVVDVLKEVETEHVQHMIHDQERYWGKVEELWKGTAA